MAPRKSKAATEQVPIQASSEATSSRVTLDDIPIPTIELPESITPDFVRPEFEKRFLNDNEREKLVQELIGFYPHQLGRDITESAREQVVFGVSSIESRVKGWAEGGGSELTREVDIGLHRIETLLNSHNDKAFDKFEAWLLRNPFDVPSDLEMVIPWHRGYDFARGEYVMTLPQGEAVLAEKLQKLRTKVEQFRLLSYRLEEADVQLDRRLAIARQRKAEIGFVKEVLASSGLNPLPQRTAIPIQSLQKLHSTIKTLDPSLALPPTEFNANGGRDISQGDGSGTKAWELGRKAYLNWAIGKIATSTGSTSNVADVSGGVDVEGLEALKASGRV